MTDKRRLCASLQTYIWIKFRYSNLRKATTDCRE